MKRLRSGARLASILLLLLPLLIHADQVEMQNGDRYVGRVVTLSNDVVVVQNELLGILRVPRSKVASIKFAQSDSPKMATVHQGTNAQSLASTATNSNAELSAALRQLGAQTNMIQQVRQQLLGDAGPEANGKFDELLSGLTTGKLNLNDLRSEAASAANQLRDLKRDLGDDATGSLDGYLAILDSFLRQSGGSVTNSPAPPRGTKPSPVEKEE